MATETIDEAEEPFLYRQLLRVKPEELTLNAWAVAAEVNRNVWSDIRKSGRARTDTLEKLLAVAKVSWAEFDASLAPVRSEVAGAGLATTEDVRRAYFGEEPLAPLPLVGSAIGDHEFGEAEEHIELTELHLGEVLEYLARPASLAKDREAYALTVVGDSMAPRFMPGERVAVSPRSSVGIGDDVIVQLLGEAGEDERIKFVLIKRLIRRGAGFIELRQFNPDVTFRVDGRRVAAIHKVRGVLF